VCSVLLGLFVGLQAPVRGGLEVGREPGGLVSFCLFQLLLGEVLRFREIRSGEVPTLVRSAPGASTSAASAVAFTAFSDAVNGFAGY
jgi:hypothetical protein